MRYGFDGWKLVAEQPSSPAPFDMHGVFLAPETIGETRTIGFTMRYPPTDRWEGIDYTIGVDHGCA
ncbi:hypothetical protein [Marinimicrococcus flavescens]|uniref:Uncharacterized protein n=1 Tax=Marinimicrococcus flavescens TaxID=3031815 RepID=A0AAP3XPT1_9PROT|nr:hypothetical protein [Marinimicrococcus flavescens]